MNNAPKKFTKQVHKAVAIATGIARDDVRLIVSTYVETLAQLLLAGNQVVIKGLGTFSICTKFNAKGRNLKTGETTTIPPYSSVRFRASSTLRRALRSSLTQNLAQPCAPAPQNGPE